MADIELLPLPEQVVVDTHIPTGVRIYAYDAATLSDYARANVLHHTEKLRAEVESLRKHLLDSCDDGDEADADLLATLDRTRKAEARAERLEEALQSVERYGADTLSGPTTEPDDRSWYRTGVAEMTRRAHEALTKAMENRND